MKKHFLWVLMAALLVSGFMFTSCEEEDGDFDFTGTWEVKLGAFLDIMLDPVFYDDVVEVLEAVGFSVNTVIYELTFTATNFSFKAIDLEALIEGLEAIDFEDDDFDIDDLDLDSNDYQLTEQLSGTYTVSGDTATFTDESTTFLVVGHCCPV